MNIQRKNKRGYQKGGFIVNNSGIIDISKLKPYENNARTHSRDQIEKIANSIREFKFVSPVIIDENNMILVGHGRVEAAKLSGITKIPFRRVTWLNADQKRAYILADNKLSDLGGWDDDLQLKELDEISLDMSLFGFDKLNIDDIELSELPEDDGGYYGDERERTNRAYHLDLIDHNDLTNDFWQMPIIYNDEFVPEDLIGFNYAKTSNESNAGIHFFIDDYQFERVWNYPEKYLDVLRKFSCVLSPDFSLYMDMPIPIKIWNVYRSRQIGAYWQSNGIRVIPTISWAEQATFEFCFRGIPKGSIVSISTIGVKRDPDALQVWHDGVDEMIKQIEPSTILVYGGEIEHDYGKTELIYYENKVIENWERSVI